jgi:hypothetical protein
MLDMSREMVGKIFREERVEREGKGEREIEI